MNLAETIRRMGQPLEEKAPPFDVSKADYAGAAKELTQYAKTKGGIDKNDFLAFANRMSAIANKKSPRVSAKFARDLMDLDTSPREKIVSVMRSNGIKVTVQGGGFKIEDFTLEELEELDELEEAKVMGREVFDKTFANRTQADNFAKKNGGYVKQVGRVFYVFKGEPIREAPEDNEPASPDEGSMAMQQLEFIEYAADKLSDHIKDGGDFPEWMQNKLATVSDQMQSLYSQIDQDGDDKMDEAVNMDKVRNTYNNIMKGTRGRGAPDEHEVGDFIGKGHSKEDIAALIKMLAKQGYDAKFLTKDLAPLAEAYKTPVEEGRVYVKTPEGDAYDAGKKAVEKGISYDKNPNKKGTKEYTAWSKGHNDARATKISNKHFGQPRLSREEVELEEAKRDPSKSGGTGYDLYHKDFSTAMAHAYKYAKDKLGIEIDPKEIDDKVASGPRKPSSGKTNTYRLKGKDGKKAVQIQVSNLDNKKYELNMYKESFEMTEKNMSNMVCKDCGDSFGKPKSDCKNDCNDPNGKHWTEGACEEVNLDELFESAFEEELTEAMYQVDIKGAGRETVMAKDEKDAIAKASKKMKVHSFKSSDVTVKLAEEIETGMYGLSKSLLDAVRNVVLGEKKELDPVNKKALKKDFDDRDDKDIDNDGDTDDSDEYLHKRRQAVSKAVKKDKEEDDGTEEKEPVGKSGKQMKIDTKPSLDEAEMSDAEMKKREEIVKSMKNKEQYFKDKYGDRWKEVMYATATKMAQKQA